MSKMPSATKLQRADNKSIRAWTLYQRGHSLESIATMLELTGSARRQVDRGQRLVSIGMKAVPI